MIDQNPNSPMTNEARIPPRKVARQKSRKNTRHRYGIRILAAVGLVLVIAATAVYAAQETANEGNSSAQKPSSTENADQIKRGEYLVHDVAKCIVCHTPKTTRAI